MANTGIVSAQGAPRTGMGSCGTNNVQTPIGYIFVPIGFELNTLDAAALKEAIGNGLATTIMGSLVKFEPQNEESPIQEGVAGFRKKARAGKPRDLYTIAAPIEVLNQLDSLNSDCATYDVIRILADERLDGYSFDPTTGLLKGYSTSMISAETITSATDENGAEKALMIDYSIPSQHNAMKDIVQAVYSISSIGGITVTYLKLNDDGNVILAYDSGEYSPDGDRKVYGMEDEFVESTTGASITGITETPANSGIYVGFQAGDKPTLTDPSAQTNDIRYWASNFVEIS